MIESGREKDELYINERENGKWKTLTDFLKTKNAGIFRVIMD